MYCTNPISRNASASGFRYAELPEGQKQFSPGQSVVRITADEAPPWVDTTRGPIALKGLHGVITARSYVMVDYDCPAHLVDAACSVTPGLESPTVSSLQDPAWSAVRAMVPRRGVNRVMDELYDLGARAILVTDIAACRI